MQATLSTYQTVLTVPVDHPDSHVNDWDIGGRYVEGTNMVTKGQMFCYFNRKHTYSYTARRGIDCNCVGNHYEHNA